MRQDIYGKRQDSDVKDPGLEAPALGYLWRGTAYRQVLLEYWSGGVLKKQTTKTFRTYCVLGK